MRSILIPLLSCHLLAQDAAYLVLQKGASSLAYYARDAKLLATVPVGQHPHEMVFSPDGRYLYTTDNGTMKIEEAGKGGNTISIIDVNGRKKLGEISLGEYHRPHGIDVDKSTGRLAVTTELPDQLLILDPVKRTVVKKYGTKGKTSHMVTLDPGGKWAYVSNSSSSNVAAVNLDNGDVKLMETGARPEGEAAADRQYLNGKGPRARRAHAGREDSGLRAHARQKSRIRRSRHAAADRLRNHSW
jgi:sugar lactone lactonase YvrE